ncbi:MAG: hypothetical protein WA820_07955 [Bradyrhizobium sp.]
MRKFAIRLLTLALYATASVAIPLVAPARAATEGTHTKKKHQKIRPASSSTAPRISNETPRNYSDDPDRRAAGGGY